VHRSDDHDVASVLEGFPGTRTVVVRQPGVLAAMTAGMRACGGQTIGFLDDDTRPRPHWLSGCLRHLERRDVGGVSGRDFVPGDSDGAPEPDPGRISRWGKVRGGHHLAIGPAREVDVLKGANLLFRREALRLPSDLRGAGAQEHFEVAMCLAILSEGWRLVFDPSIVVDHVPAPRSDGDRGAPSATATRDAAYNLVRAVCELRPEVRWRRAVYGLLIGDRAVPGLARATAAVAMRDPTTARRLLPSVGGQLGALRDSFGPHPLEFARADEGTDRAPAPR
jgi:hypothetical protein